MNIPVPHGRGGLVGEVFKVSLDRIQQRLVEQNTLTFQFRVVEVFTVYAQDTFLLLHPRIRLVLRMRLLHLFFALCPKIKKCEVGSALGVGTECGTLLRPRRGFRSASGRMKLVACRQDTCVRTTTTTRARRLKRSYTSDNRGLLLSPAGAMFGARDDGEGAARRRRERRLHS